jgi:predicted HNH restriction endonuclease
VNYWLMSLKYGDDGDLFFEACKKKGVIACDWWNENGLSAGDLNQYSSFEALKAKWHHDTPIVMNFLWDFYNEMAIGDVVYIRGDSHKDKNATIIGKCRITSEYKYDNKLFNDDRDWIGYKDRWGHYRNVEWLEFTKVRNEKVHNRSTIYKLNDEDILYLKEIDNQFYDQANEICNESDIDNIVELADGAAKKGSYTHYERHPKNRQAAVDMQGLTCRVCGFNFEKTYGQIGEGFIEVHHIEPLANSGEKAINPRKDLVVLCSNCHRMLHRMRDSNITWENLRSIVEDNKKH